MADSQVRLEEYSQSAIPASYLVKLYKESDSTVMNWYWTTNFVRLAVKHSRCDVAMASNAGRREQREEERLHIVRNHWISISRRKGATEKDTGYDHDREIMADIGQGEKAIYARAPNY